MLFHLRGTSRFPPKIFYNMGSGWVAVGRVIASEIDGSNPVIGKFIRTINCIGKTKIKKKMPGMAQIF